MKSTAIEKETPTRVASSAGLDALTRFLENRGEDFIYWRDGSVVIETYYDKQFRALGGDTHRLISFFEDYSTMHDAARHYIAALRQASNAKLTDPAAKPKQTL